MTTPFEPIRQRGRLSASAENAKTDALARATRFVPAGGTQGAGGHHQFVPDLRPKFVRIVSRQLPPYGEILTRYTVTLAKLEPATDLGAPIVADDPFYTEQWPWPVYELNNNPDVPCGAIVEIFPADTGEFFWFNFPRTRIKARITDRTVATCGNSGSGDENTDHDVFTYSLHSQRAVNDGDGCPTWIDDDYRTAIIIETAYELNNNEVEIGALVEAEQVAYTDESQSGSGDSQIGPAACRWVFSAPSAAAAPCIKESTEIIDSLDWDNGSLWKRYWVIHFGQDDSGCWKLFPRQLLYSFDLACSPCGDTGSDPDDCTPCQTCEPAYCLTIEITSPAPGGLCANIDTKQIHLTNLTCNGDALGISGGSIWSGVNQFTFVMPDGEELTTELTATLLRVCVCDGEYSWFIRGGVALYRGTTPIAGYPWIHATGDSSGWLSLGTNSSPTTPPTLTGQTEYPNGCIGCCIERNGAISHTASFTLNAGVCSDSGGSGPGNCPCRWQSTGLGWGLMPGYDAGVCTTPPPGTGTLGETRYTNADGTDCVPSSSDPSCADCGPYTSLNVTVNTLAADGRSGWLTNFPDETRMVYQPDADIFASAASFEIPGTTAITRLLMWCENGRWRITLDGSGQAFTADAGSDCLATITFALAFTSANTLVPGQAAGGFLSVVIS